MYPQPVIYECENCGERQSFCGGAAYALPWFERECRDCGSTELDVLDIPPQH